MVVVGISDSVEGSETAGLGFLSLFAVFLTFFCLGIMKSNFNIYLNLKIMMKTVLGCGETVTDWPTVNIRTPFYTIARLCVTTWHVYLHWVATELGPRCVCNVRESPILKPTSCVLPPSSYGLWFQFFHIYLCCSRTINKFIRVHSCKVQNHSILFDSYRVMSCSIRTTSHCVLVKFNMHEWRSLQWEWPEYSTKARRQKR